MFTAQEVAKKRRSSWEVCAGEASEMRTLLDQLEEYSGVYEETAALRKRLERIERACARGRAAADDGAAPAEKMAEPDDPGPVDPIEAGGDPKTVARSLIAQMPLRRIFQDPALSDAFLSELLLALARESSSKSRKDRQRQGIEEAKAQGVRFGAPKRPLPANFEEVRRAWRDGQFSLSEAAQRCGMAKTTFYNAAQRVEKTAQEAVGGTGQDAPRVQRPADAPKQRPQFGFTRPG